MNFDDILLGVLSVLEKCNIKSYPIDCIAILNTYHINTKPYNSLSQKKYKACMELSEDACIIGNTIYFNNSKPTNRIRFSLMHELGHIVLDTQSETAANYFASHLLAPRMAIHYSKCANENEVSKMFKLTLEASLYAFNDYKRWHRNVIYFKMNDIDRKIYNHFYDHTQDKFIYKIQTCKSCNTDIYNTNSIICPKCKKRESIRYNTSCHFDDKDFLVAEYSWLYGE